ncbi:TonB-dependent receptor plug domain-containing protein [Pseudoalteromonas ulvae]|uniref:TonB-dependent receptor n=1 Tax=Pseudoalteromonas ulvae TaxID=107327 RepID=A0A244CTL6_PSEDV|nr:TonB-dependent receptor [Pseudoalteromonas ulvae]OUL58947.1 TonB-dependent receptor [Pseudoalteromonas ulvae]
MRAIACTPLGFACLALSPQYLYAATPVSQDAKNEVTSVERIEVTYRRSSIMAEITEDAQKLVAMPGAMGDPLQAAFALPGVVAAGGSMSDPAVRGSSPSDNLFEVDFMPAGYIFHDFGMSIFNRHLIQDFKLYSAGYGTSYSNATGAVFDVNLRNPKYQPIKTTLDFTMFNAGVFLEGQLSESTAFYFSARKSTLPLFFDEGEEVEDEDGELTGITINAAPDDNDYQGKFLWDVNSQNSVIFSFTGAQDKAGANFNQRAELALKNPEYQGDAVFDRNFNSQSLIWDHASKHVSAKVGVGILNETERLEYGKVATLTDGFFQQAKAQQVSYKARVNYHIDQAHSVVFDAAYFDSESTYSYDMFQYVCTELDPDCDLNRGERINGHDTFDTDNYFIATSHVWQFHPQWQSEAGLQWQTNKYTDESFLLPRIALNYYVTQDSTITAKFGQYNRMQDLDVIAPGIGNPKLDSQRANHATVGFSQHLADDWSWSIEGYYKTMENLPLALQDSELLYSNQVEGQAYGVDLLINKNKTDNWYGWFAISYAKSERTDLQQNITRDYYADTPLVVNMVFNYQINERWNGGFNFTARSGQAYTPIVGVKENPDYAERYLPIYGEPFSERFDVYHRLDIRFERDTDFFGLDAQLILEVMNVYGQDNTSHIDLDYQKVSSVNDLIIKEETDDFEMRPSIGFSVSF